ncbi:MAG: glutathione peroxidase [Hyphomicrobium aestuarii]|nr:glutathione peroxidase [Hyphomicrobium aestuarii]
MVGRRILGVIGTLGAALLVPPDRALAAGSAYDHVFKSIDGTPLPLSTFRGQVVLVVNTASLCGFTQQYRGLQAIYQTYEARGFVVVGVPSNDFGGQEPKAEADVKSFCEGAFGVTFPLTAKYSVTGSSAHPFYQWAGAALGTANRPLWNFHKYLVGRDGNVVAAFGTQTSPESPNVKAAIEAELAKPAPAAAPAPSGTGSIDNNRSTMTNKDRGDAG